MAPSLCSNSTVALAIRIALRRMRELATLLTVTPSIAVTIGGQERVYHAFVTTAAPTLDGPSTMTLHASTLADVSGLAADPLIHDPVSSRTPARLVLIETRELAWHRAKYRAAHCLCAPADPVLVSLRTLQFWLWQRLQAPLTGVSVAAH